MVTSKCVQVAYCVYWLSAGAVTSRSRFQDARTPGSQVLVHYVIGEIFLWHMSHKP